MRQETSIRACSQKRTTVVTLTNETHAELKKFSDLYGKKMSSALNYLIMLGIKSHFIREEEINRILSENPIQIPASQYTMIEEGKQ